GRVRRDVPLPAFDENAMVCLCVLGGSLCCFCSGTGVIGVWELKYSGEEEEESWTKLFTIELREHFGQVTSYMPLQFLKNGKILLGLVLADRCLHIVVYDPNHATFETIKVHDESLRGCAFNTSVYEESLFSLGTGTYLGKYNGRPPTKKIGATPQKKMMILGGGDGEEE
ncbi:hypothetical protein MKW92_031207, partial [Papaver armeniacum]